MIADVALEDTMLTESAADGDSSAVDKLFKRQQFALAQFISAKLNRRLKPRLDANDVVQDIFALAVARLPAFFKNVSLPFPIWLHAIAVERLGKVHRIHIRTKKRSVCCEIHADQSQSCECLSLDEPPNTDFDLHDLCKRVKTLMAELPQCYQDVLRLRIIEERPIEQVATLLGIKCGAVRMRQNRALRRLRDRFLDELPAEAPS